MTTVRQGQLSTEAYCARCIIDQLDRCRERGQVRRSHYFEGRHENLYVDREHLPALEPILAFALRQAGRVLNRDEARLKLGFWFNAAQPGQRTLPHCHDDWDELLSGVFYVQATAMSGRLHLHTRPRSTFIEPRPGRLVLFPPNLVHEVEINASDTLRLSLGFNVGPAEQTNAPAT